MKNRSRPVSAVLIAAAVIFVVVANRNDTPFDGKNLLAWIVPGLAIGGIYAASALGLVVTYTTTGIFNFAHGAIGCLCAFVYWDLRVDRNWPAPIALFVVVCVFAPLLGLLLERLLMRRLRQAVLVVQLMVTVGLMLALMGTTFAFYPATTPRTLPHFFESSASIELGAINTTWHRIIMLITALLIAIGLRVLLYRTRLGVAMRAVVDNRALADLNGINANVVSSASWALGCMLAAIAGILIAPETGMEVGSLTLVIVVAFAAAAIGRMKSLPWTFAGGLLIGLASQFVPTFLQFDQNWTGAQQAVPALTLFIALLFLPQARLETGTIRITRRTERLTRPWEALVGAVAMVLIVTVWANGWIPWFSGTTFGQRSDGWLGMGIDGMIVGLLMLSLVPLIGWAGQVNFANFAIAGFGACMFAHFGGQHGNPIGILWTVLICAPLGVVVALPALRLKGLYLALSTAAFAELADKILFRHPKILDAAGTSGQGALFKPLHLFGFTISSGAEDRKTFVVFLAVVFAIVFFGLELLRRTRWARRWIAISDSPAAAATVGINLQASKVMAFALSGALAGLAGTMYGLNHASLQSGDFPLFAGIPLVLLLAVQGVRYPVAAFMGAVGFLSFPALQQVAGNPEWMNSIQLLGPGVAAMFMAYRPEGGVFYAGRDLAGLLPWRSDARAQRAAEVAEVRSRDVRRNELGEIGVTRDFDHETIAQLDRVLGISDDVPLIEYAGVARETDEVAS